jgi:hypothetical protein
VGWRFTVRGEGFGGVDKSPQGSGQILVQLSSFMMIGVYGLGLLEMGAGCMITVLSREFQSYLIGTDSLFIFGIA